MSFSGQNDELERHKAMEEARIFKRSSGDPKIMVADSDSVIKLIFDQSISALSEENINTENWFFILFDLANCIKADPSIALKIEIHFIMKIYDSMKEWNLLTQSSDPSQFDQILQFSKLISAGFNFIYIYIKNHPNPDLRFLLENDFIPFSISKIPIDSPCNCLVELFKLSDNLEDPFNLYHFMFENDLRSKLLFIYRQFNHLEHQQIQILKVLQFLLKKVDFTEDELNSNFFETSEVFLQNVFNGKDDELVSFLEFLLFLNSDSFYTNFPLNEEFSQFFLAFIIAKLSNFDSKEQVYYRLFELLTQFSERSVDNVDFLINHKLILGIVSFLKHKNLSENLKLSAARYIEFIINLNSKFVDNILCTEYFELMQEFLNDHGFFDQSIAFRYISILLQNFQNDSARDCLQQFDPVEKIVIFLGSDYYEVISMLLIGISNVWTIHQNGKTFEHEVFAQLVDLMNNQNFYETITEIDNNDYNCAALVQNLIKLRSEIVTE